MKSYNNDTNKDLPEYVTYCPIISLSNLFDFSSIPSKLQTNSGVGTPNPSYRNRILEIENIEY